MLTVYGEVESRTNDARGRRQNATHRKSKFAYNMITKQRCAVERIRFDPQAPSAGRRRNNIRFREPSLLRGTARSGAGVSAPGHAATAETGPDQVTRLTVVLENPADAQLLVRVFCVLFFVSLCPVGSVAPHAISVP